MEFNHKTILLLLIAYVGTLIHGAVDQTTTTTTKAEGDRKHLEELEEAEETRQEKEASKVHSKSKANQFLSYDKCMQRMKCPSRRVEECSEECKAGNTEEEVEEHSELTIDERGPIKKTKKTYEPPSSDKRKSSKDKKPKKKSSSSSSTSTTTTTGTPKTDTLTTNEPAAKIDTKAEL